jgi:hypothetical protein
MAKFSKNARQKSATHTHHCRCGGTISMGSIMIKGRMKHYAMCDSCKAKGRRPSNLMAPKKAKIQNV